MTDFSTIKELFHITESNGFGFDEIETIQNIFGTLPKVFSDYYTEFGKIQRLNQAQDSLIVPERFQHYNHDTYLIFYTENQHACVWGIHKDDLALDNPPVYISNDQIDWNLETETLKDFFTAMAFLQAGFALDFPCNTFYELEEQEVNFITKNFYNKNVSFARWLEGVQFYGNNPDDVIIIASGNQLSYASNTKELFIQLDNVLSKLGTEF